MPIFTFSLVYNVPKFFELKAEGVPGEEKNMACLSLEFLVVSLRLLSLVFTNHNCLTKKRGGLIPSLRGSILVEELKILPVSRFSIMRKLHIVAIQSRFQSFCQDFKVCYNCVQIWYLPWLSYTTSRSIEVTPLNRKCKLQLALLCNKCLFSCCHQFKT